MSSHCRRHTGNKWCFDSVLVIEIRPLAHTMNLFTVRNRNFVKIRPDFTGLKGEKYFFSPAIVIITLI